VEAVARAGSTVGRAAVVLVVARVVVDIPVGLGVQLVGMRAAAARA
jgi:hypothetical protein